MYLSSTDVKSANFRSQLEASHVSIWIKVLEYNETVFLDDYIIYAPTSGLSTRAGNCRLPYTHNYTAFLMNLALR